MIRPVERGKPHDTNTVPLGVNPTPSGLCITHKSVVEINYINVMDGR